MRHLRTLVPALVTSVVVAAAGAAFALAGASPALSASAPAASGPVADLLAGSYQPEFGRLSVAGGVRIKNKRAPVVSGKTSVGRTLSVTAGSWNPAKVDITYAWYAGSKQIRGATRASYSLGKDVVGEVVTVRVTASKKGYRPASVDERAGLVKGGVLTSRSTPSVRGTAKVGERLSVTSGSWSEKDVSLSYAWLRGRKVLATTSKYTVQRSDRGSNLRVEVTASKPGYRSASAMTAPTAKVRG